MTALAGWWELARVSLTQPRQAARAVLAMRLPAARLWELMALMAALTALMLALQATLADAETAPLLALILDRPILTAAVQFVLLAVMALALLGIGRMFGGTGDWRGALALVVWLQAIKLGLSAAQVVLALLSIDLAGIASLVSLALEVWLLTYFAAELHGFTRPWLVFLGILGAAVLVWLGFIAVVMAIGAPPTGVA